ncbi:aminoacyl-histidine dipeptidase [Paenibacillus agaridevorans]|uniref:Cytosol non-specific dipeptidase n=1 Tax=Paenibacillus agaridevorans TaxID=171404 RepID=A0A2R5ER81_9BACL|nr:aminoacyl-histidine dipeptidase [Paenibacillus agaridevorans]GBG07548.1 aminoacyl-histidine dipeptidase [Paenibacillus agaridevorans]
MKKSINAKYTGDLKVLQLFEQLSAIPRGSGNEKAISDFVADFARQRGCEVLQDERHNLIIRKQASAGYEHAEPVIFQGHLDMVCEKNKGTVHDFENDPITLRVEDDFIYADGTTLGADNGIAVATALALIDSAELAHPELEILMTTEEETTMGGAFALDVSTLKGRRMINFDSDREGVLFVSSAGGVNLYHTVPIGWREAKQEDGDSYVIVVQGLRGGHSGDDIIHERGNANKLLGRALGELRRRVSFGLASVTGGMKANAIPREAEAAVYIRQSDLEATQEVIADLNNVLSDEYRVSDGDVRVELHASKEWGGDLPHNGKLFDDATKSAAIGLLELIPNGVLSMDKAIPNLVRTSSNLGIVSTGDESIVMQSLARSSHRSQLDDVLRRMETLSGLVCCGFRFDSYFPGWPYLADSRLRPVFEEVYMRRFGNALEVKAIHAGLECGVLVGKIPELDAVSYGPNLYDIHTPQEHLSITSVERSWAFLVDVLRALKQ